MTKVVLDVDERTLDRVTTVARSRRVSVESIIVECVAEMASLAPIDIENSSHRALLAALERPSDEAGNREDLYDRERARAEVYMSNRERLLALVDETDGDMGDHTFDRERLYDR